MLKQPGPLLELQEQRACSMLARRPELWVRQDERAPQEHQARPDGEAFRPLGHAAAARASQRHRPVRHRR